MEGLPPFTSRRDHVESLSVQRGCVLICPRWPAATVDADVVAGKPGIAGQAVTTMYVHLLQLSVVSVSLKDVG